MTEKHIIDDLLLQGLDDMLHLGWITQTVAILQRKDLDDPSNIELTIETIRDLLESGYVIAGSTARDPADGLLMVKSWDLSPKDTIERIKKEWNELSERDRDYLVWLELTEKGRQEARRIDEMDCDPSKEIPKED